jgi:predicted XRE-type DNA-binding protein
MPAPPDVATIHALRSDLALQISRVMRHRGLNQLTAAKQFGVPQPTLSKIANGRVADLSLELLIRIAVRAGLPVVLQTGQVPEEAGVFVSGEPMPTLSRTASGLADAARASLSERTRRLTPEQRLAAFLVHTQLGSALHQAGHVAEAARLRKARRTL